MQTCPHAIGQRLFCQVIVISTRSCFAICPPPSPLNPTPFQASTCSLQRLDVHGADLTPAAIKVIINVVKQRTKSLDLVMDKQERTLLAKAQQLHAAVVQLNRGGSDLLDLNLKDCITDEAEAVKLFEALRSNHTVASLTLQGNVLGVHALRVLSECLMQPTTGLSSLNLSSCIQSMEELFAFVSGLKRNTTVKYLNLNDCHVTQQAAIDMLCDCLTANTTLLRVKGIPTEGMHEVALLIDCVRKCNCRSSIAMYVLCAKFTLYNEKHLF